MIRNPCVLNVNRHPATGKTRVAQFLSCRLASATVPPSDIATSAGLSFLITC